MKGTINNELLKKLKPQANRYDVWDDKLGGFHLRVNTTGKMFYRCAYARSKVVTIGKADLFTPVQARDRARQILGNASMGIHPENSRHKDPKNITLKQFIENEYKEWKNVNFKSAASDLKRIEQKFYAAFGDIKLPAITSHDIEKWRTQRLKAGIKSTTVNRDIAALSSVLTQAMKWHYLEKNPIKDLKFKKAEDNRRVRYLSTQEEKQLKDALRDRDTKIKEERSNANIWRQERGYELLPDINQHMFADHLEPMILVALHTGMRKGELFNLQWENINFELKILTVTAGISKDSDTRHIPLNSTAFTALIEWKKQCPSGDFVFTNSYTQQPFNDVKKAWLALLAQAKIHNFHWHDMRHHFASKLVMAGVDLNTVRELLGHEGIKMSLRYAHLAPEHKAMAVAKIADVY